MFQLSGLVTVDDQEPDAFLHLTRARYQHIAQHRMFLHAKQAHAVSRCQGTAGEANIVGHGRVGIICTGSGRFLNNDPLERIDVNNIGAWAPGGMTKLTLLGCNTGEGEAGADLTLALANATGATVRAPWGYVYIGNDCPDFYLETDTGFIEATPGHRPQPVFDSRPEQSVFERLLLRSGASFVQVDAARVTAIALFGPGGDGRAIREWMQPDPVPFDRIEFDRPLLRGHPAAIETGRLVVEVSAADVTPARRVFCIYNDNCVQDLTHPQVLYRANIDALRAPAV